MAQYGTSVHSMVIDRRELDDPLQYKIYFFISFIGGFMSGLSSTIIGYPLDNIRIRLQTIDNANGTSEYEGTWDCIVKTVEYEGFSGLYKGVSANFYGVVPLWTVLMMSYDCTIRLQQKYWPSHQKMYHCRHYFIAGATGGFFTTLVITPLEQVRNLLAIQRTNKETIYEGFWDCITRIYQKDGVSGLYKGLLITWLRDIPSSGIFYVVAESILCFVQLHEWPSPNMSDLAGNAVGGVIAGFIYWIWALPFDTWRNRVQVHKENGDAWKELRDLVREEGIAGLYRGFIPTFVRGIPVNAMVFVTNFYTKKWLTKSVRWYLIKYGKRVSPPSISPSRVWIR